MFGTKYLTIAVLASQQPQMIFIKCKRLR